ncbi:ribosome quality control complex subunit 1 [Dichotomopilus funicola]|uniref:Ribosome quality control complex subunit 1 n=1 Tax=Dichotomopilus funicola TaxID=1934379 RepID=A0AAN6ZHA4_9PEZI|nr:ribosome quality control complex subunit 1 [Dichotomopilus funicola]
MASRQLRKLRKQQELLSSEKEPHEGSEESEDEPVISKPRGNMFSGFAALGGDDDQDGDDNDDDEDEDTQQPAPEEASTGPTEPAKKSKKKSKKKKKKGKQTEASTAPAKEADEPIDEIDQALQELKMAAPKPGPRLVDTLGTTHSTTSNLDKLLQINFQHLKALNEMRRVFGKAMDVAEGEEQTQNQQQQQRGLPANVDLETFLSARAVRPGQNPQQGGGSRNMFDTILRTNPFIDGKKSWPRGTAEGLKMIRVTEAGSQRQQQQQGPVEFAFAHDRDYDMLEASFFQLVQMYDPMQIVDFLYRHPYHVSSLIQVSKVARQDQNSALAADLIERALFTFGRVSLSEFRKKLEKGQARLSFARPENRQFYLAGYNLIQKLVLKGTYRTALEWAKLFLSVNHRDPYGTVNWIHVLAIRAHEAEWFVQFCASGFFEEHNYDSDDDDDDDDARVRDRSSGNGNDPNKLYAQQTLPLAHFQLGDTATAKSVLAKGMTTLPWLYCALFSALNLDAPKPIWGVQPRNEDEALHTELYLHTAKDLWNTPQHTTLLKETAASLSSTTTTPLATTTTPLDPDPTAQVTLATARFIYLDNTPHLMSSVPRQMLHTAIPNFEFDPLPPAQETNLFTAPAQRLAWSATEIERARQDAGNRPAMLAGPGARALLAQLRGEIEGAADERLRRMGQEDRRRGVGGAGERGDDAGDDADFGDEGENEVGDENENEQEHEPSPGMINFLRNLMGGGLRDWTAAGGIGADDQGGLPPPPPPPRMTMPGAWDEGGDEEWGDDDADRLYEEHMRGLGGGDAGWGDGNGDGNGGENDGEETNRDVHPEEGRQ